MKLTKRKIWGLWIIAVVVAFALVLLIPGADHLTVHLVDKTTGKPLSCTLELAEHNSTPFLSLLEFLPLELRQSNRERLLVATNGIFQIRRKPNQSYSLHILVRPDGLGDTHELDHTATTN